LIMADIECRYCRTMNDGEEHRCTRCGRRLSMAAPRSAPDTYPLASGPRAVAAVATAAAAAPGLSRFPEHVPEQEESVPERATYQQPLFRDGLGSPKVIPIPTLTPLRVPGREAPLSQHGAARNAGPRSRRASDLQQALEFHEAPSQPAHFTQTEGRICEAPVALPAHRMIAAAVDISVVLLGLGVFVGIFFLAGGDMVLNRQTTPFLAGVAVVIGIFYRFLWTLANGDTPGMRFAGLRLVDFDGQRPEREQRAVRQVAGILSLLSAGLGLVWALVDEDSLTWHDHISKTFPTPGF
jgi:uncharacterized RDD family membrane protein YckC